MKIKSINKAVIFVLVFMFLFIIGNNNIYAEPDVIEIKVNDPNVFQQIYNPYRFERGFENTDVENQTFYLTDEQLKIVTSLEFSGIEDQNFLSDLTNFSYVENISITECDYVDLDPLANFTKLNTLSIFYTPVDDISSIENLINLKEISIENAQISDLTPLTNLTNVETLHLSRNNIESLEPLEGLTNLTYLKLDYNKIENLEPLRGLNNLSSLSLINNKIQNVEPLKDLASIEYLGLGYNNISDVSPLANINSYLSLSLEENNIEDISSLRNMENLWNLNVVGNHISDILGFDYDSVNVYFSFNTVSDTVSTRIYNLPNLITHRDLDGFSFVVGNYDLNLVNCTLSEDEQSIILNPGLKEDDVVIVGVEGGRTSWGGGLPYGGMSLTLYPDSEYVRIPKATIKYTNNDDKTVTAKISFNKDNITILNNNGSDTYVLEEGEEFTFEFTDENGTLCKATAKLENEEPEVVVEEEKVEENVSTGDVMIYSVILFVISSLGIVYIAKKKIN